MSFTAAGNEHTVPVTDVWAYEGASNISSSLTVHDADGRTQTIGQG